MILNSRLVQVSVIVCVAAVVAGCTSPTPGRVNPTLTLLGEGDCPYAVSVRLTNNDPAAITASYQGFKMVDSNGTVGPVDVMTTLELAPNNFPATVTLAQGESAQGIIVFTSGANHHPYTLKYDYDGMKAEVRLNEPPAGEDGCGSGQTTQKPNLVLTAGTWNSGNLTLSFASIVNGQNLNPIDLTYLIQDPSGTTYFTGTAGTGSPVSGVTVTVAYQDNANIGRVSNEDNIRITVSPNTSTAIRGGSFKIFFAGDVVGFINQLP